MDTYYCGSPPSNAMAAANKIHTGCSIGDAATVYSIAKSIEAFIKGHMPTNKTETKNVIIDVLKQIQFETAVTDALIYNVCAALGVKRCL